MTGRHVRVISVVFVIVHALLLTHSALTPESFMSGDRAGGRLQTIESVFDLESGYLKGRRQSVLVTEDTDASFRGRLLAAGNPGDYVLQGALLTLGDRHLIILFQLLLQYLSVLALYALARVLGRPPTFALLAALLYTLLPGSLILPHELASEAIHNPLIVVGVYLIVRYLERATSLRILVAGSLMLSFAIFVRPQLGLYPVLLIVILTLWTERRRPRAVATVAAVCFLLPAGWGLYAYLHAGEYEPSSNRQGLGIALQGTVRRMSVVEDFPFDAAAPPGTRMSPLTFAGYVVEHPAAFVRLKATESFNLVLNPGTYSVAAHHFGLLSGAGDTRFWKELRDRAGITGMMVEIVRRGPLLISVIFVGAALWGLILLGALVGGIAFCRDARASVASRAVLIAYLFYGLLIVLVSGEVRWTHRTSVEFVIVLLFVVGLESVLGRVRDRRSAGRDDA